eukprot:2896664-Pyramimonas_sp.AAC.1
MGDGALPHCNHLGRDIQISPCAFMVIQEAARDVLKFLQGDPGAREPAFMVMGRPASKFVGVAGVGADGAAVIFGVQPP